MSDRGRIYIKWGKPDEIESHPAGSAYERMPYEGGGSTTVYPFERWFYRSLPTGRSGAEIEFVDPSGTGEYRMARNPDEKDASLLTPGAGRTLGEILGTETRAERIAGLGGYGRANYLRQVAEVKKFNVQPVQDLVDLAAMIVRHEMVPVPAVTDTYILFGVGARVDGGVFTRYVANQNIELNDEAGLSDAYARLETAHANLQKEISGLQKQLGSLKKSDFAKQDELQKEINARQRELKSNDEDKAQLDKYYGPSNSSVESRPKLWRDYESLQALAKDFRERSLNLDDSSDRQALKIYLLSSLRPEGLKILEEVAKRYHYKFDRPLPVSSLIRCP